MAALTKQPCTISTQRFNKRVHDDAACREEEQESLGYLVRTAVLVRGELRVHRVWLWGVGRWDVEHGGDHQRVLNNCKAVKIARFGIVCCTDS